MSVRNEVPSTMSESGEAASSFLNRFLDSITMSGFRNWRCTWRRSAWK